MKVVIKPWAIEMHRFVYELSKDKVLCSIIAVGQVIYAYCMHDYKIDSARVSVTTSVAVVFAAGFAVVQA